MIKLFILSLIATFSLLVLSPVVSYAQSDAKLCQGAGGTFANGECTKDGTPDNLFRSEGEDNPSLFVRVADILLFIVGAVSVIMLIIGGIRYVISAGDASAVSTAKNTILYAIVGIVVAFMAFAAVRFVTRQLNNQ